MEKTTYYCDRCKKPIGKGLRNTHNITVWARRPIIFRTCKGAEYDLCQSCYNELYECYCKGQVLEVEDE